MFKLPRKRKFLPPNFKVTVWSKLKPYFVELERRVVQSKAELLQWVEDLNELQAVVKDDFALRSIQLAQHITDTRIRDNFEYATKELQPKIDEFSYRLQEKLLASSFLNQLSAPIFKIYIRQVKTAVAIFRKESLELMADIKVEAENHRKLFNGIKVNFKGEEMSYPQAYAKLESLKRSDRKALYAKIEISVHQGAFEKLFESLLEKRQRLATQTGFGNFRSYQFQALNRFDYKVKDCEDFHIAVEREVLPVIERIDEKRMAMLKVKALDPSDTLPPVAPEFQQYTYIDKDDFFEKCIHCLNALHPAFGESLQLIKNTGQLDLSDRPDKHHSGFCVPMLASGIPYISQRHKGSLVGLKIFMQLVGQVIHAMYAATYNINSAKDLPQELKSLSAMTMQFLSLENGQLFFDNETDWRGYKLWGLEQSMRQLLRCAAIDKFQHWVYTHPNHSRAMREQTWAAISNQFASKHIQSEGDGMQRLPWFLSQRIFAEPFNFIEYGFAQLGALEIWKSYKEQAEPTILQWIRVMEMGYTRSIPELYELAGAKFDFSAKRIRDLATYVEVEYNALLGKRMG